MVTSQNEELSRQSSALPVQSEEITRELQLQEQQQLESTESNSGLTTAKGTTKTVTADDGDQQTNNNLRVPNRKGSFVSFKEKCDLFEIKVTNGSGGLPKNTKNAPIKPAALVSLRYYIMLLALVSPFVITYSRTIINFAITDMIQPPEKSVQSGNITIDSVAYYDLDNSCPVSEADRTRLNAELFQDEKRARETPGEKFKWDTLNQGLLKAAYPIGHALLQVVGGRLSEIYGSHLIMGLSALLIGVCCLGAPMLASIHFYLIFADLLLLGVLGSFVTPALITMFSNWLTPSEKSITMSLYLVSSRLGYALSSLLCGLLINAQLSWRYLFYSGGFVSIAFGTIFLFFSRSRPHEHPFISQQELEYLAQKNTLVREAMDRRRQEETIASGFVTVELTTTNKSESNKDKEEEEEQQQVVTTSKRQKNAGAPWRAILTSRAVWAFVITKFCVKLAGDTVQTELPTYLKRVMHFSAKDNGLINASNYVIFSLSCLLVGALAKAANKRRPFGWSKTTVRKLFQTTASFGVALILLGISFSVCNNTLTQVLLMFMFFFTTFGTGGEAQIPLDISVRYAGTIHAIGSSLAISGAIEPILVGFLLRGHPADQDSWSGVWLGAGAIASFGGLVFLIFGDATLQAFDPPSTIGSNESNNSSKTNNGQAKYQAAGMADKKKLYCADNTSFENDIESDGVARTNRVATTSEVPISLAPHRDSTERAQL